MTTDIKLKKIDNTWIKIECEQSIFRELQDHFSFFAKGYQWHPQYKARRWDGKIRLIDLRQRRTYIGLTKDLVTFSKEFNYNIEVDPAIKASFNNENADKEAVEEFLSSLQMSSGGKDISFRDYQQEAITTAILHKRLTLLSPTSSGKSAIIYAIMRWLTKMERKRVLIVVPSTGLVEQMFSDFADYSKKNDFDTYHWVHRQYGGKEKNTRHPVVVSTWQSVYKNPPEYFDQFGAIIVDETHQASSDSLKGILEKAGVAEFKIGLTGTLDQSEANEMLIKGLIGPVKRMITTKELMERGQVAQLKINMISVKHEVDEKTTPKMDYNMEVDFIRSSELRKKFLVEMVKSLDGNVLILANHVDKYIRPIFDQIKKETGRPCYLICGGVETEERERIRQLLETEENAILVASYGTMSTGISIKKINHVVFAQGSKSFIRVIQSIGRGLRLADGKLSVVLHDIVDDVLRGYAYDHARERAKFYKLEKFEVEMFRFNLKDVA